MALFPNQASYNDYLLHQGINSIGFFYAAAMAYGASVFAAKGDLRRAEEHQIGAAIILCFTLYPTAVVVIPHVYQKIDRAILGQVYGKDNIPEGTTLLSACGKGVGYISNFVTARIYGQNPGPAADSHPTFESRKTL